MNCRAARRKTRDKKTQGQTGQVQVEDMRASTGSSFAQIASGPQGELTHLFWRKRVRVERTDDTRGAVRRF
jgi:hypothetical protein